MLATQPLALISVSDGRADDLWWIAMDGDAETCNPQTFINAFPETSCVIIDGTFSQPPRQLMELVVQRMGAGEVCLVDSYELFAFPRNEDIFHLGRYGAIDRLPTRS